MTDTVASFTSLTTMRVGGKADRILVARNRGELIDQAIELWNEHEDWLLLGGGSNTIVSDEGYPGALLLVRNEGIQEVDDFTLADDEVRVRVQAGHDWDSVVVTTLARGWGGLEALSGIPGCAGAAPIQNIGAYGTELSHVLHSVEFLDASDHEVRRVHAEDLELGYRDSALKRRDLEGVVISIDLILSRTTEGETVLSAPVNYDQLAGALGVDLGSVAPAREVRERVLALRSSKGMVLDAADHDTWSSGSFFTNPIVSEDFAKTLPSDAPRYPMSPEAEQAIAIPLDAIEHLDEYLPQHTEARRVKLSAAWLIEHSGIRKGFQLPGSGASISMKHTLAITNRGAATAEDVAELARYIRTRVQSDFGVHLIPEPNIYGLQI